VVVTPKRADAFFSVRSLSSMDRSYSVEGPTTILIKCMNVRENRQLLRTLQKILIGLCCGGLRSGRRAPAGAEGVKRLPGTHGVTVATV